MQRLCFDSSVDTYSQIENSENYQSNKAKEKPLNTAVEFTLDELKLNFADLTSHNNFINSTYHHEADYLIPQIAAIENKNWDCYNHKGYTITKHKAETEILSRFKPYLHLPIKILIIAKPRWGKGVKPWVESRGITIIEVGYQVNKDNLWQAYQKIKSSILSLLNCGYPDITSRIKHLLSRICSLKGLIGYSLSRVTSTMLFFHKIRCKFKLRSNGSMDFRLDKSNVACYSGLSVELPILPIE